MFSYCLCHEKSETTCSDTASLLADTLAKNYAALFGKKMDDSPTEKDGELPAQLLSALRQVKVVCVSRLEMTHTRLCKACDQLGSSLLPQVIQFLVFVFVLLVSSFEQAACHCKRGRLVVSFQEKNCSQFSEKRRRRRGVGRCVRDNQAALGKGRNQQAKAGAVCERTRQASL